MADRRDGNAIVYCEGAYATTNGKTAHGLVRRTGRYLVLSVVDSTLNGRDAGEVLDGRPASIPILGSIEEALSASRGRGTPATHLVVGLAPDGGRLADRDRAAIGRAVGLGLNVDCGLHDFLGDDPHLARLAAERGVRLRDIRRPPPRSELHFFSGEIDAVGSCRIAMLGTDSAVGKRTTAWMLVDALRASGKTAEMIGTGQTAWLQGATYGIVLDSLVNDFVAGEIEHAIFRAWQERRPDALVVEGQGSLLNPAYPGGFEILAAGRPHCVVVQHAPARLEYDGFPGHTLHPLGHQLEALRIVGGKPVVAVAVNHQGLSPADARAACRRITVEHGLPAVAPLLDGVGPLVEAVAPFLESLPRVQQDWSCARSGVPGAPQCSGR